MSIATALPSDIREFELKLETNDGERRKFKYKVKGEGAKAKISSQAKGQAKNKVEGEDAIRQIERIVAQIGSIKGTSKDQLLEKACATLGVRKDQVRRLELEAEFSDGSEVEAEI